MKQYCQFNTDQYQPISWTNIFESNKQNMDMIVRNSYSATQCIFNYTVDHLSHRKYDHKIIAQIESVKSQFIDVIILFKKIDFILKSELNMQKAHFVISELISALHILSKCAGARAILIHHSIELAFHLKLFQKSIAYNGGVANEI